MSASAMRAEQIRKSLRSTILSTTPQHVVICQLWEESERGWVKPDGCSLHLTKDDIKPFIKDYNKDWPKEPMDEYDRTVGSPYEVLVDDIQFAAIKSSKHGLRVFGAIPNRR